MKVLIATGLYPPDIGGPATYALMLESELASRGIELHTVPFGWVRKYPKIIRHFVYFWKLLRESKEADIIYALDPMSVGVPALLVSKLTKKPFLVRLGGDYAWEQGRVRFGLQLTLDEYIQDMDRAPWRVRVFAKVQTYVVARAKKVIVPSNYLKNIVKKWGVKEQSIAVVYSALYPLEVSATREQLRSQLEYTSPTIVSAARLVPWKGFEALIQTVKNLQKKYPDITLIIIGDGEERERLQSLVAKQALFENVRFTGRISKDALGASIKAADVFVLNTAYEGLSHQLIEVMDLGVPIVTTRSGGNPELITDGVNGYLVDFNSIAQMQDAISRVIEHPESRERITQSARGRSKDFKKEIVVEGIVSVLNDIYADRKA